MSTQCMPFTLVRYEMNAKQVIFWSVRDSSNIRWGQHDILISPCRWRHRTAVLAYHHITKVSPHHGSVTMAWQCHHITWQYLRIMKMSPTWQVMTVSPCHSSVTMPWQCHHVQQCHHAMAMSVNTEPVGDSILKNDISLFPADK